MASVSSLPSKDYECPNCRGQYIKIVDPSTGKCIQCWPCPECLDGQGLSVKCGATVPEGTKIHCVLCVNGANFSDSFGTDQCQPCGVCAGEHEHVLNKCTYESDVKCDCKAGFYRNKTNDKCLPCGSCRSCLRDKDIFSKCQKDGGEQQITGSSTTMYSTSLVSSLVTSSHSHYATSLLPGLTITRVLVPTRTRQISLTSTSVLEHEMTPTSKAPMQVQMNDTHKSSSKKTEIIFSVLIIVCVCLSICVTLCVLYHTLKNSRTRRINNVDVRFSELNQGAIEENEQGNDEESSSCETSSVDELNVDKTQHVEIIEERNGSEPDLSSSLSSSDRTADSAHQDGRVIVSDHPEHTAVAIGIPSSLEDEQRNCISQGKLAG